MNAVVLYVGLTCFTLLCTGWIDCLECRRKGKLLVLLLVLWFFYALSSSGTDYVSYLYYYENFRFSDVFYSNQEVGFIVLNSALRGIISNPAVGIAAIKTLTFCLTMFAILRLSDQIEIGIALLMWYCLQYYDGYLVAMSLAAALVLLGISFMIKGNKSLVLICLILASLIHYSAIVVLAFYFVYTIVGQNRFSKLIRYCFYAGLFVVTALLPKVIEVSMNSVPVLRKYMIYTSNAGSGFGIMQFFYYMPIGMAIYYLYRNNLRNKASNIFVLFSWLGFFVAMMGYRVGIFDRMFVYYSANFILFVPYVLKDAKINMEQGRRRIFTLRADRFLLILYAVFRVFIFISEHFTLSSLDVFTFFWQ